MIETNAVEIARRTAAYLRAEQVHVHRGVCEPDGEWFKDANGCGHDAENCLVIFGNDGFLLSHDSRSRREVELVRAALNQIGLKEIAFALDPDGLTWAMIVECDDADLLQQLVWDAWRQACRGAPK